MYERENVFFPSHHIHLKGWFYRPTKAKLPAPCIIMTHGFSALKEHGLDEFAGYLAKQGMCVLVYDNRNFGESEGTLRFEIDPYEQIYDMQNAITYVQKQPAVNKNKIGLWGTSFSGGTLLVTAALDERVKCAVSQVPFIQGHHTFLQTTRPIKWSLIKKRYDADRLARLAGKKPTMIKVASESPNDNAIIKTPGALSFFNKVPQWENQVTLKSLENAGEFEPSLYLQDIRKIPVLFIVAEHDTVNPTALAIKAYEQLSGPKKLVTVPGDHFAPFNEQFSVAVTAACEWFRHYM